MESVKVVLGGPWAKSALEKKVYWERRL